jgi:hypothetical protein
LEEVIELERVIRDALANSTGNAGLRADAQAILAGRPATGSRLDRLKFIVGELKKKS